LRFCLSGLGRSILGDAILNYAVLPNDQPCPSHPQTKQAIESWQSHRRNHRRYTRMINFREHWKGYLWQGRFASYPMEKCWVLKAAAYVELNPVKAGLVKKAWDYRWSSVHAHLSEISRASSSLKTT